MLTDVAGHRCDGGHKCLRGAAGEATRRDLTTAGAVRLSGTVFYLKATRRSYSEFGFRSGRSALSAMAGGRMMAYRRRELICLKRSGENLAISA